MTKITNSKWRLLSVAVFAGTLVLLLVTPIPAQAKAIKYTLSQATGATGTESGFCILNVDATGRLHWLIVADGLAPGATGHFDLGHILAPGTGTGITDEIDVAFTADATGHAESGEQFITTAPPSGTIIRCDVHLAPVGFHPDSPGVLSNLSVSTP